MLSDFDTEIQSDEIMERLEYGARVEWSDLKDSGMKAGDIEVGNDFIYQEVEYLRVAIDGKDTVIYNCSPCVALISNAGLTFMPVNKVL